MAERRSSPRPSHAEGPDIELDRLVRVAAIASGVPMGLISVKVADRLRIRSTHGMARSAAAIESFFCARIVSADGGAALVIGDAAQDARCAQDRMVTEMGVRFQAGVPISVDGKVVGALCVFDTVPHEQIVPALTAQLADLAAIAASLLTLRDEARVRARTAAELIKEEWRHALTLEAGKVGSWVWDIRSGDVAANDIFRRMFGIDPVKAITIDEIFDAIHVEDRPAVDAALAGTFEDGVDYVSEFRVRSGRWLIGRGRVYQRDAAGKPLIMMGVNIDITDAREAADHTRHLLRELNHRVKNTLAMIQSLARHTLRQSPDPQQFIDSFSGRLRTLSEAHALLSDRDWSGVGLADLIHSLVGPHVVAAPEQLVTVGPDVQLAPDQALGLGLILHELSSNARKFGAFSTPRGKVSLSWQAQGGKLDLLWKESGGPPVTEPKEFGLGVRLIQRSLDKILESRVALSFPRDGVEARIALPLG